MILEKSVLEFGAKGDGCTDDYAAFAAALASGADRITIPTGIYPISETLKVPSDTEIIAARDAKIVMAPKTRRRRGDFLLTNADHENGNQNIRITGGIWDGNNQAPENAKPDIYDKNGYSGAMFCFLRVTSLTVTDAVLANTVTYYVRAAHITDFLFENIDLVSDKFGVNQDGLHFGGDVHHGTVRNLRALSFGQTNDDMVAFNADDCVERVENLDLPREGISDITVENIFCDCCHTIIRLLSVTAPIKNIRVKNVFGGFRCYAINADGARYCRTPLIDDTVTLHATGAVENCIFEDVTCYPVMPSELPADFGGTQVTPTTAIIMESLANCFEIRNFRYLADEETQKSCPALRARNLTDTEITADGQSTVLLAKSDLLAIPTFTTLAINKKA